MRELCPVLWTPGASTRFNLPVISTHHRDGRVEEEGSHEVLMARAGSMYRGMWERQLAEELQKKLAVADGGITASEEEEEGAVGKVVPAFVA